MEIILIVRMEAFVHRALQIGHVCIRDVITMPYDLADESAAFDVYEGRKEAPRKKKQGEN